MPTADYLPLIDNHVSVKPGQALRLFPFGTLVKGGKRHEITPELAGKFRLPHFKAPIKLGSHEDDTPAGGFIVGLEVRADGLYGLTEVTPKGEQVFADGDYRYHSPEVIWEGAMEDPQTGASIDAPLIVGTALLHTPHLGEAAALYEARPEKGESKMTAETKMVSVPETLWDRFTAWLDRREAQPEPAPEPTPKPEPTKTDEFAAALKERDEFKAKFEALQAEHNRAATIDKFEGELANTKIAGAEGAAEMLAGMTEEQAAWTLQQLRALSGQIEAGGDAITQDVGKTGGDGANDAVLQFDAAVKAAAEKDKLDYGDALQKVVAERPELYQAYMRAR